jgi:hypothetical protein
VNDVNVAARALEELLRRSNKTLDAERAALAAGRWAEHLAERVPAPSRLAFLRYGAWRAAYERALEIGAKTETLEVVVFPIWYGANESEEPASAWTATVIASFEDGSFELYENAALESAVAVADVEVVRRGFLALARSYAPDIALPYRNATYAVVESRRVERVATMKFVVPASPVAAPQRSVPPFATDAEPALALDAMDRDLAARVRHVTQQLRIFPES